MGTTQGPEHPRVGLSLQSKELGLGYVKIPGKGLARAKGLSQVAARTSGAKSGAEHMNVCVC